MDIVVVIIFVLLLNTFIINVVSNNFKVASSGYLWLLFAMHFSLTITYMIYAASSSSDSVAYYRSGVEADNWLDLFGTGTIFISFCSYPFIGLMGLSYYATMIIFSFFGYLAVLLFYITVKENVQLPPVWNKFSYIELVFLLPNIHFWSSSLGKGSTILFALGLFAYGLSRFNRRIIPLLIGGFLIYMVRPHILFTMILSIMLGVLLLPNSGIKGYLRWLVFIISAVLFYFISDSVVQFAETDTLNIFASSSLTHRVEELSKASSGIDLANYNIFMKMFTFWFRPLFFDGLGIVGIIASFENLFYLYMAFIVIREGILHWRDWNGWFRICLFFFLLGSIILAQVSGNLGIAMRQKAQMMPFFFIIFCKALSYVSSYRGQLSVNMQKNNFQ